MTTEVEEMVEHRMERVSGRSRATRNSVPAYWGKALAVAALGGVTRMEVQAQDWPREAYEMPAEVREGVVEVLERGCAAGVVTPRVELKGFSRESGEVWPEGWRVVMSEWPEVNPEWRAEAEYLDFWWSQGVYPHQQMPLPDSSDEDL